MSGSGNGASYSSTSPVVNNTSTVTPVGPSSSGLGRGMKLGMSKKESLSVSEVERDER